MKCNEVDKKQLDEIVSFLDAYPENIVSAAIKHIRLYRRGERIDSGWKLWTQPGIPPKTYEWRMVGKLIQYRDKTSFSSPPQEASSQNADRRRARTDASTYEVPGLACPKCGAAMYKEGVCPGCEDGKKGYRIRLLCGECDKTILL